MTDFTRTRAAIAQWRIDFYHVDKAWQNAMTDEEHAAAETRQKEIDNKVLAAFSEDTAGWNDRETVMQADVLDIIEMMENHR